MLPSLVVEEVRRGVAETLRAQFEPSTELFEDAIRRLIVTTDSADEPKRIASGEAIHARPKFAEGHQKRPHNQLRCQRILAVGRPLIRAMLHGHGRRVGE